MQITDTIVSLPIIYAIMANYNLGKILFLDIETVSAEPCFSNLDPYWQKLWEEKTRLQREADCTPEDFYPQRAGILAEFGKIVCISCGFFTQNGDQWQFRIKSFYSQNEKSLLAEFSAILDNYFKGYFLCAHNGKEFDFPYLGRRMLIQQIKLPEVLQISGLKPWEVLHLDTLELWKFGDRKNYTSLKLLAALFNIPTPKDDIDGSMVGHVFWEEKNLNRIVTYCEKDVVTLAKVFLAITQNRHIEPFEIIKA